MTVNRKIIDALAFLKIPVAESFYDGKEEEYITFETPIDSGADFGDDEPGKIIVQVRVHWWIPITDVIDIRLGRIIGETARIGHYVAIDAGRPSLIHLWKTPHFPS